MASSPRSSQVPVLSGAALSVTEVRNALRCPRVFALGRITGRQVAFPLGSSCLGGAFHRIVDRFAATVASPPAELSASGPQGISGVMTRWLLGFLKDELEADPVYATMPAEVDDLAEALRQLAQHLAARMARFPDPPATAIRKLVRSGEHPAEALVAEAGVLLRGRLDALYGTQSGELQVIEYKLTEEANLELDRAQAALYRMLLKRGEGLEAEAQVLRFNPELSVTRVSPGDADRLLASELVPLLRQMAHWSMTPLETPPTRRRDLCAVCPVARLCLETFCDRFPSRDDPPAAATRPRPAVSGGLALHGALEGPGTSSEDEEGRREAEAIKVRILDELRKDGIAAEAPDLLVGSTCYSVAVVRRRGPVAHLDRAADNVRHRLASSDRIEVEYSKEGGHRTFLVRRPTPRPVLLGPLLVRKKDWLSQRSGRFVLGETLDGRVLAGDLADSATPHLLVGGQAGSGKSSLLKTLVASLVHFHDPALLRVVLLDPKRVTFGEPAFHAAIAAHSEGPVLHGIEDAMPCLERYIQVMEARYEQFEQAGTADLNEYNSLCAGARLPRYVIVMDEFQDLTSDKKAAQAFCQAVSRLGAKARAAGVHLILATQRPDRDTVPSLLKSNLGGKIALRVASSINSRVVIDQTGAELLFGNGDLLADLGKGLVRAQGALLSQPDGC